MDPLETLLRPVADILNRNIRETTPARELCQKLDGKIVAIRVRDTALAMYFEISDEVIVLRADYDSDPDVVITGSLLTLARMAGGPGEGAVRHGSLDLTLVMWQHIASARWPEAYITGRQVRAKPSV
jgi:ubiquinone biosynthesis protein UbiJ